MNGLAFLQSVLIALVASSCALFSASEQRLRPPSADLGKALRAVCFSGEGKGRVILPNGRYSFSYQALHQKQKRVWLLELDFFLGGDQLLSLDYSQLEKNQITPGGSLYQRLKLTPRDAAMLHALLLQFAKILAAESGQNLAPQAHWDWEEKEGGLELSSRSHGQSVLLKAGEYRYDDTSKKAFYRKIHISLGRFELQLFPSSCQ